MLRNFEGHTPRLHPTAHVDESALIIGQVELSARVSLWPGCVLRGDVAEIIVGEDSNLQDGVLVHTSGDLPVVIGRGTTVGHGAILHGCTIGGNCLIGMGSIILDGAVIGDDCIVGAGAVVTERTRVPRGHLVVGVPGRVVRPATEEETAKNRRSAQEYVVLARLHRFPGTTDHE